jgi:hypothetical protein
MTAMRAYREHRFIYDLAGSLQIAQPIVIVDGVLNYFGGFIVRSHEITVQ